MAHDPPRGTTPQFDFEDFICTCDEEGVKEAESLMTWVKERLSEGTPLFPSQPVADGVLLTAVVTSLSWSYNAHISKIIGDQWWAVFAESYDGRFKTCVSCDFVEHGVAAIWRAFADHTERQR